MNKVSWSERLSNAQTKTIMMIGSPINAHLYLLVSEQIWSIYEAGAFNEPQSLEINVSPYQFHSILRSGTLIKELDELIRLDRCDIVAKEIVDISNKLGFLKVNDKCPFESNYHLFGSFCFPLFLSDIGIFGIKTTHGFWYQIYEQGWPINPPTKLDKNINEKGLLIANVLSPKWFTGLPYTLEGVENIIPDFAKSLVKIVWHPEDDIFQDIEILVNS